MIFKHSELITTLLTAVFVAGLTTLQAQESVSTSGGDAFGNAGSMSYSVGQLLYSSKDGSGAYIIEGVQQPYEVQIITGINHVYKINLSFTAYPNPTSDFLTLQIEKLSSSTLHFQLVNMNGQILRDQTISDAKSKISMQGFSSSIYFLKVMENQDIVKTFKIVKN